MTSSEKIRQKAFDLGFSKVGFARAETLEQEASRLEKWLDLGYHGTMNWMNRNVERRSDPALILPGAKSVISLALNYYTDIRHSEKPESGKISRYAWGDDYHDILGEKLKKLWRWLEEDFPGIQGRWYVDTGPVMEKAWAQRAGIGWIGKHSNLISQDMGSWLFLGELITTLELEYDTAETDHCGTCTMCIDACPTEAIVEPYVVDSVKCISYLTIEHRGDFGTDVGFEGWIYGCDICQDVCPWNERFSVQTRDPRFFPREENRAPMLEEWKRMTAEEFRQKFRGSSIKRTKVEGIRRNVQRVADQSGKRGSPDPNAVRTSSHMLKP